MSRDVAIGGYFSKPKGFREQRSLGNTDLSRLYLHYRFPYDENVIKHNEILL